MKNIYSIGEIAKLTGCKVTNIRYFEQIGLLMEAGRSEGAQRRYNSEHLTQLQFIMHCRELDFSHDKIRQLTHLQECSKHSPHDAHEIAARQLVEVQSKIKRLQSLERELLHVVENCHHGKDYRCGVLEALK